jgi:hypothetical protein
MLTKGGKVIGYHETKRPGVYSVDFEVDETDIARRTNSSLLFSFRGALAGRSGI